MLLSSAAASSVRGRSRSWGHFDDGLLESIATSPSAPSLLLGISPKGGHHKRTGSGFVRSNRNKKYEEQHGGGIFLQDLSEHHSNLADLKEETALVYSDEDEEVVKKAKQACWDLQDTWEWYDTLPWLAGMNYLPRTAVNFVEMWDETSFNPDIINEELKWAAEKLGYNTLRTNIPMVLYEHDAEGLTRRINKFLRIAAKNGFVVMLCPLDDCEFSGKPAQSGPQPEPVPGLHNSQAIGSPGRHVVLDPAQWFRVEEYIRYIVRTWGHDKRIFLLDLYNEPGNPWVFRKDGTEVIQEVEQFERNALKLMEKVFQWAREENPTQPLTVSAWHMPDPFFDAGIVPLTHPIDKRAMELSDVISVHAYCDPDCLHATLMEITNHGKPILLTEWMARQVKSTYESAFPTLKELKVGAYQWGLVQGKTQTHLPWPHVANQFQGDPMWWHDVLDAEGNFHSEQEGEVIRSFVYPQNKALSSDMFLFDVDSMESLDSLQQRAESHAVMSILEQQQHLSENQLFSASQHSQQHLSHHQLALATESNTNIPTILEGEQAVIPSVCSISMATINAAAAVQAAEHSESFAELTLDDLRPGHTHHSKSTPTFASHMATPSMECLDLAESGGIEF